MEQEGRPLHVVATAGRAEARGEYTQVLGHPMAALAWLATELELVGEQLRKAGVESGLIGSGLQPGHVVMTGTTLGMVPLETVEGGGATDVELSVDYEGFGRASVVVKGL